MDFKVSSTTIDGTGVLLVSVEGELDISSAEQLVAPTEVAVRVGCPLILDLSECEFIDSTGLRSVLHAHRVLADIGEPLAVVTDGSQVRKMLSVTAVDLSIPVFDGRDEAIAWLGAASGETQLSVPTPTNGRPARASRLP